MISNPPETPKTLLAYFSHSYRPSEKEINLFFWDLLSKHHLYFTVDSEENRGKPMDISYLEWMMRRSACFVAVIPRRDDSPPYNCSPYQIFENGLAIRAKKPRLIFVEKGLNETIFGVRPGEVYSFRREKEWLEEEKYGYMEATARLAQQAHTFFSPNLDLVKPVALLADMKQGTAYSPDTLEIIEQRMLEGGFSLRSVSPTFEHDFLFLQNIEQYSVLISEVRLPYIAPDVFGLVHSQCIPMIRICHLEQHEVAEEAKVAMHLPSVTGKLTDRVRHGWPRVLSRYQIDGDMEPVIFWSQPDELAEKIGRRLQKMADQRRDLRTEQKARYYFLSIGRLRGKVFISNPKAQNEFVEKLKEELEQRAVDAFHYKNKDAILIGSSEWKNEIVREINNSLVFIAVIDSNYTQSPNCMAELDEAITLFHSGRIEIYAYVVESGARLPDDLSKMQVDFIETRSDAEKITRIAGHAVSFFEMGKRVHLRPRDREQIVNLLATLPALTSPMARKSLVQAAGVSEEILKQIRADAPTNTRAAIEIVDDLAGWTQELKPRTKALGLLLSHVVGLVNSIEDQKFLAGMIRGYWLMPDIRLQIGSLPSLRELCSVYHYARKKMGTFQAITKGTLTEIALESGELSANVYSSSVQIIADRVGWQKTLQVIGTDIFRHKVFESVLADYGKMLESQGIRREQVGFCFASDGPGLRVPFEWAIIAGQNSPLCRNHPVRRFLVECPEPRSALRAMLEGDVAIPLRVLLIASNTGSIPNVEREVEEIYSMFRELFAQVGWPESNIRKLDSQTATASRIQQEIASGHYHILHFAGHGGYDDDGKPVLQVYYDADGKQIEGITAIKLKNWIENSDLRFVYLSTCRSASTEMPDLTNKIQQFENMAQAIVEARVPEVIGFIWPIQDVESKFLANRFYNNFLKRFDASQALYQARASTNEDDRIWAAPVLIQQSDSRNQA